jgi:hypothetical protein
LSRQDGRQRNKPRTSNISVIFFITDELLVRMAVALWV